jgi:seryl-tRNA synthetase
MKFLGKYRNQKGEAKLVYILTGIGLTIAVIFLIQYYQDHRQDVVVHVPHVEVH